VSQDGGRSGGRTSSSDRMYRANVLARWGSRSADIADEAANITAVATEEAANITAVATMGDAVGKPCGVTHYGFALPYNASRLS
jgi:hypothetical protein